ncbi:polyphosphoinositide phosphatase isoform X1 [Schistocerca gregaria]|uniref:polyphosphoinositide phosphatase isoform X1 n=1 Tax=Schistocerca gregaria TaxID=7010 RepID=UPI00211E2346|nr:polyphosphoinositide phosphatase isoform X1 [Schistocerca gregaria]
MANKKIVFHPIISPIQKIALYETKSRFYLMGTNNTQTRFRVLKIDRMEPRELIVVDDKVEYSQEEIRDLVTRIDVGNRTRVGQRLSSNGVARIVSAFGIVGNKVSEDEVATEDVNTDIIKDSRTHQSKVSLWQSVWKRDVFPRLVPAFGLLGFIRFLEGYYIILITKRRLVAVIGHHTIYKIEDTSMIYIPNDGVRISHPDEPRYVKMFQNIDLSSNFYFSYSYDITHTLQSNMTPPRSVIPDHESSENGEGMFDTKGNSHQFFESSSFAASDEIQSAADYFSVWSFGEQNASEILNDDKNKPNEGHPEVLNYGVRNSPNYRFVWNSYLLSKVEKSLHPDWILYVTHGFVGQSNISIFGRSVYITLIARRSNRYAGTRFLKRGANFQGDVANEVETEQIVHDSGLSSLILGHFSAFVQLRGSIPAQWSQDISKIVPKPAISFDLSDPFAETAGEHFNQLFQRYGAPIIILNLVKKREKKKHESMLSEEFSTAIAYLNQFLPPDHQIQYISFDMARIFKGKEANVMGRLGDIAHTTVCKTGIFHNQPPYYTQNSHAILGLVDKNELSFGRRLQTGVIRVNCVDCLDRTNTAQFAIGKCALGFQLCALGVLDAPRIDFDSDCVRMLEELYEDHGDTLALQYGGSQLVHRIKTYRKTAPWTSQGNDIMQTLSRYYSNTFSDAEKQHTINLFLGLFVPDESRPPIWEMATDYYLHHKLDIPNKRARSQWWDTSAVQFLPRAYEEVNKRCRQLVPISSPHDEAVDSYADYYRPHELSVLCSTFAFKISHSVRDFMPNFTTNFSPFAVRVRPGRRREEMGAKGSSMKNPSLSGQSSSSSTTSSASSTSDTEESEEEEHRSDSQPTPSKDSSSDYITFETLFPPMRQVYGMEIENPKKADIALYKRFAMLGLHANNVESPQPSKSVRLIQQSAFSLDSSVKVSPPRVSRPSVEIYKQYVNRGKFGATDPSPTDLMKYQNFVNNTVLNSNSWDDSVY